MSTTCDYCRGPLAGGGHAGRAWPDKPPASYCCFGCLSLGEADRAALSRSSENAWKIDGFAIRIGISLFIVGQSMIFGLALNLHEDTPAAVKFYVQLLILAATLIVVGLLGWPLLRNAVQELRQKRITVELLFLLTLCGAFLASTQSFISGSGPIYFEVVSVLLVVYSLSKAIGARSRAAALASSRQWAKELATCRRVDESGQVRSLAVEEIRVGDRVEVRPGESFAVDGEIIEGIGFVSEAPTRGEPFAIARRPGDRVLAGTISHDALFRVQATAPGNRRQIDALLSAVEQAKSKPLSIQSLADRLTAIFLPILLASAIGAFAWWTWQIDWQTGIFRALSVLLVACPCALGLATPIVLWSALGRLAERGILVQSGDVIERLATVNRVIFDKTGTLTEERYALIDVATFADGDQRRELLSWLAAVQRKSQHPIATAFAELALEANEPSVVELKNVPGWGVSARLIDRAGGERAIQIGRPEWFEEQRDRLSELESHLLLGEGHRVAFAVDGSVAGLAVLTERLRDSVRASLTQWQNMGIPVEVLTGDRTDRAIALSLPNPHGGLLPEQKRDYIERLIESGERPLMVGDGINDASALKASHVGFAMATGTDIALGASDAVLYSSDLQVLPWAVALSREALRTVRRNIFRASLYNLVGITLAACGLLHPIAAALLMVVSSLLVAWSSVRIGVPAHFDHCFAEPKREATPGIHPWLNFKIFMHSLAFVCQGWLAVRLLDLHGVEAAATIAGFTLIGSLLTWLWLQRPLLSHNADMSFGMLSLGNAGMLLGWWADNGFKPFQNRGTCECVQALQEGVFKPWMWILMLFASNAAMLFFKRRVHPNINYHRLAMFTGGNLGMVLGMFAGGWLASLATTSSLRLGSTLSFAGMTFGMIFGMMVMTKITQWGIGFCVGLLRLPDWLLQRDAEAKNVRIHSA